jgi:hypothetical protein
MITVERGVFIASYVVKYTIATGVAHKAVCALITCLFQCSVSFIVYEMLFLKADKILIML